MTDWGVPLPPPAGQAAVGPVPLGLVLLAAVVVIALLVLVELFAGPSTPEPASGP
jgi:hypothetical protein